MVEGLQELEQFHEHIEQDHAGGEILSAKMFRFLNF